MDIAKLQGAPELGADDFTIVLDIKYPGYRVRVDKIILLSREHLSYLFFIFSVSS